MASHQRSRNAMGAPVRRVRSLDYLRERDDTKTFHTKSSSLDLERILSRWDNEVIDLKLPMEKSGLFGGKIPIQFPYGDPENPMFWSNGKKLFVVFVTISSILNSSLASSIAPATIQSIATDLSVVDPTQVNFPTALYFVGWIIGTAVFGPLSELIGRRVILSSAFTLYMALTLACGFAPSWNIFLVVRFLQALCASAPLAIVGTLLADIYDDSVARGRAMAFSVGAILLGIACGPIVSLYTSTLTWRWTFWSGLIIAGPTWIALFFVPETYSQVLLKRRARAMRRSTRNPNFVAPIELTAADGQQMVDLTITRAVRMIFGEMMVSLGCLYLALVFAVFEILRAAYPLVFEGKQENLIYGLEPRSASLAFIPIAAGGFLGCGLVMLYDTIVARARRANMPWSMVEDYRRLPLACMGCPLLVVSLLWLGWSANTSVHWMFPMLAGLPFGVGFLLIFASFLNHLLDSYEIFATSAIAATFCCESVLGAVVPFVTKPLYDSLNVNWTLTVLAGVSLALVVSGLAFIWCASSIRTKSPYYQDLMRRKEEALANAAMDSYGTDSSVWNTIPEESLHQWRL